MCLIYMRLYFQYNVHYDNANKRMSSTPKVCIADEDFRLKGTLKKLIDLFLEEEYAPLLLSNYISEEFLQCPYFSPVTAM